MIYVLFGPPGVGKSYISKLIGKAHDLPFFDADELYGEEEIELLRTRRYQQADRDVFISRLISKVEELTIENSDLILAEAFTKEKNRIEFSEHFGERATFISIESSRKLARMRMSERLKVEPHIIDADCFDFIWDAYDEPLLPHSHLKNTSLTTDTQLISDFDKIETKGQ
jgi:gluconokinase